MKYFHQILTGLFASWKDIDLGSILMVYASPSAGRMFLAQQCWVHNANPSTCMPD